MEGDHRRQMPYLAGQCSPFPPSRQSPPRIFNKSIYNKGCNTRYAPSWSPGSNHSQSSAPTNSPTIYIQHSELAPTYTRTESKKGLNVRGLLLVDATTTVTRQILYGSLTGNERRRSLKLGNEQEATYSILSVLQRSLKKQWRHMPRELTRRHRPNRKKTS